MSYSRFFLCDLQVHTPADRDHRYGNTGGPIPNETFARQLVEAHKQAGVEVIAVTDHNRVDWYPVLRQAGDELGVYVFPGTEVSVNGCHLLLVWDRTEVGYQLAQRFLEMSWNPGQDRFDSAGCPRHVSRGQILEVAKNGIDHEALVLAPHSTKRQIGLFSAQACRNSDEVAQSGRIAGFDLYGNSAAGVLINPNRQFNGKLPRWFISGDVRSLDEVGRRAVYLKLNDPPTLEGMRQAFIVPETRIRFPEHLKKEFGHVKHIKFLGTPKPSWPRIKRLEIFGGFHDGLSVDFGPGLNAIIGGKGTGKSTVVEIIRHVLNAQLPTGRSAQDLKGNRARNFRANCEAEIVFIDENSELYRIRRSGGDTDPHLYRGATEVPSQLVTKRARIRIFGQRELQSYAEDPGLRRDFLAWHAGSAWSQADSNEQLLISQLDGTEGLLAKWEKQLTQLDQLETELSDLRERLDRAKEHGVEQLVAQAEALARADRQMHKAEQWPKAIRTALTRLDAVRNAPPLPTDLSTEPRQSTLSQVEDAIITATNAIVIKVTAAENMLAQARTDWSSHYVAEQEDLARSLADAGFIDLSEMSQAQGRAVEIEAKIEMLKSIRDQAGNEEAKRGNLLRQIESVRLKKSRIIEHAAEELSAKVGERVRVRVEPLSDRSKLLEALTNAVRGLNVQRTQLERVAKSSPRKIAAAIRGGAQVTQNLGCSVATASALCGLPAAKIREIERTPIDDVISIEINVGDKETEQWINIDEASPGQRATAMLALTLSSGSEPLIIDQPEDDLDNRYIYEEVVRLLVRVCEERQVVVATHNANIPVLGDAELILALDARAQHSAVLAMGGLVLQQLLYRKLTKGWSGDVWRC